MHKDGISDGNVRLPRRRRWRSATGALLGLSIVSLVVAALGGAQQLTPVAVELVSININGASGNAASSGVAANADGSVVAFYSDATDLVRGDTNQVRDVFVRDRPRGVTERISVNSDEEPANLPSHATGFPPAITANGQVVAFYSEATNLSPNDSNGQADVFIRVRDPGHTDIVSVASDGSQGNGPSVNPSISGTGRYVAFQSQASNLVPNDTNAVADIFVRDLNDLMTERICDNIEPNHFSFAPSISADGNFVAFTSAATNLVPSVPDRNGRLDIFVCNRSTGQIDLASVSTDGAQGNADSILPAISEDGRFVAFKSLASNLVPDDRNGVVDVFVRDRLNGTTERVSVSFIGGDANDASFPPSISYDGRFVAFGSAASNIVRADVNQLPSVFVRDRHFNLTLLVDVNERGEQANGATPDVPPSVSGDGRQIGYVSFASNLKGPDRNETADVFIAGNPFFCPGGVCPDPLMCQDGMCVPEVVPTPTPTSGACCQCAADTCAVPTSSGCPAGCDLVQQAACLGTGRCAAFTPVVGTATQTPTPTATGPTATPTATLGANDCCQCEGNLCELPSNGACPASCDPVRQAACLGTGRCATFTPVIMTATPTLTPTGPTATPTATLGVKDCCQCEGNICAVPSGGGCPATCNPVRQAACLDTGRCATLTATVTATPTATFGVKDCCQCEGNICAVPSGGGCPATCNPVRQAACLDTGRCATLTATVTATPTATLGAPECCQCEGNTCAATSDGVCPGPCTPVRQAACLSTGRCATFTPITATVTATPTPTGPTATPTVSLGVDDCCQCAENTCAPPREGRCPGGCDPVLQAACLGTGMCATFTPVGATPTSTPNASASPTRTQGPVVTPTRELDLDACHCAVGPNPQRTRRGVLLWLSAPALLVLRHLRKRRKV